MFFHVFVYPTRLKLVLLPARIMQKIRLYGLLRKIGLFKILPEQLRKMEQMLPSSGSLWARKLPPQTPVSEGIPEDPDRPRKHLTIAFFPGCIGSVMFDVDRYVGIFDEDPFDAVTHEEQLARGEISLGRDVVAGGCERSQRLVLQTAFRKCDAQWIHVSPDRRW